jgi:hypothetical protein
MSLGTGFGQERFSAETGFTLDYRIKECSASSLPIKTVIITPFLAEGSRLPGRGQTVYQWYVVVSAVPDSPDLYRQSYNFRLPRVDIFPQLG